MAKTGTVKFFNADKGYGFIQPDDGSADSFVHITAVQAAGMQSLDKDQRLNYDVEQVRRSSGGAVDGLLIEVEDSNPDRYVVVPLDGLTTRAVGDDIDLQATMTAADIEALPDAEITPASGAPAAEPVPAQ